jgi:DNA polymerase-3 subunit gamma/tau
MRDALTILDRVIAAGEGHVGEDLVREQLGIVPAVRVQAILASLLAGDAGRILDECQALTSLGADWTSFWRELMMAFRDRLEAEVRRGALPHELVRLARMLHLLLQRERDLRDTSLPQVVVELALLTASQLPHLAPLDALIQVGNGSGSSGPSSRTAATARSDPRPSAGSVNRATPPQTPLPGPSTPERATSLAPEVPAVARPVVRPIEDPSNLEQLRKGCSEALKAAQGGLPRTLASLPHMATELKVESHTLRWFFPTNVRNTVQDLEREQSNPHLLEALRQVLPGISRISITFEAESHARPEDSLRMDPVFQRLLQETGGEIVEAHRVDG